MPKPRYNLPKPLAALLTTHDDTVVACVMRACARLSHEHPEWAVSKDAAHSLAKRVDAELRGEFSRIMADRQILTWLEEHRAEWTELAKLPGGLRKAIVKEMERRGDLPNVKGQPPASESAATKKGG